MTKVQEEIQSLQDQREKLLIAALEAGGSIYKEDLEIFGSSIETLLNQIRLLCDLGYAWETDERLTLTSEGLAVARKILDYQLIA